MGSGYKIKTRLSGGLVGHGIVSNQRAPSHLALALFSGLFFFKSFTPLPTPSGSLVRHILPIQLRPSKYICSHLHFLTILQKVVTTLNWIFVFPMCLYRFTCCSCISSVRPSFVLTSKFSSLHVILLWRWIFQCASRSENRD